jgi:folate-binding protein YgfZ
MSRELPLAEHHREAGAVMTEIDGWLLPAHYGSVEAEHRAVSERVGLVDRSALGKVVVTGRDRAAFLHGMLTNDIKGLKPGQGCPAAFLDAHGKVKALLCVYALADRLLIELPPGMTATVLQALDHFLISEKAYFEPADEAFAVLALQGPEAPALLSALGETTLDLAPYGHVEVSLAGVPVRVIHRREAAVPGFHCWVPTAGAAAVWSALHRAGAQPVGMSALEVLRVEAGVAWYGADIDDSVIMPETRLEHMVHYAKGCYIGQEVVARVKYRGHVNRALTGLRLEGLRVPSRGAVVLAEDREVGRVTSAVWSLALEAPIALAYVRREHLDTGHPVSVRDGEILIPARVTEPPFSR